MNIQPTYSSLDYPGKMALVLFIPGCDLRCKYCHNPQLLKNESLSRWDIEEVEEEIDSLEKQFRENNINRLSAKTCLADAGIMFFDLLSNLERIGDHANNIATVKEKPNHKIHAELC